MVNQIEFFRKRARDDLLSFCVLTDKFFIIKPHHERIAQALERIERGEIKRLRIEMPPRSGKSRMIQEFIAWYLGRNQRKDIIYTGHSLGLLQGFSRNIRNRIQSTVYSNAFKSRVADDAGAVNNWALKDGGEFAIYGVGGGITGKGFNIGIIDDPYSSREDAESDTIREKVWQWYISTFYSRRQDENAAIILIMQRWREDDLAGQIEETDGQEWEVIKIPAIENGKSFWEEKFSVPELNDIRSKMGDYFFMSQYQQDPINEGGGAFKKEYFQKYNPIEAQTRQLDKYIFVDPAISLKEEADFTAIVTIGIDRRSNHIYVLDIFHGRIEPDTLIEELFVRVNHFQPDKVGIETVQYQKMLALEIKKQMSIRKSYFVLEEVKPMGEKEARIKSTLQPRYANRTVWHNEECIDLELELLKFPNSKHDDLADAMSGAVSLADAYEIGNQRRVIHQDYGLSAFLK